MASLYDQMTGTPNYDDILNSNLSREQKAQAIRERGAAYDKSVDREKNKKLAKLYAGAVLEIGSAAIPIGGGARLAGSVAKALAPRVGRKIAQEVGTGLVGGALSGGVFGTGRGLMEDKNPLVTAAQDALVGSALGGGIGYGTGKIMRTIDKYNNPWFVDEGLKNNENVLKYIYDKITPKNNSGLPKVPTDEVIRNLRVESSMPNGRGAYTQRSYGNARDGVIAQYYPTNELKKNFALRDFETSKYNELMPNNEETAQLYYDTLKGVKDRFGKVYDTVSLHPVDEYKNMRLFLSPDKTSGFAIQPDGDIVSVFGSKKGAGSSHSMLELALQNKGYKLDNYDVPRLRNIYENHGFNVKERLPWDDAYWDPQEWDKNFMLKEYGVAEPDITYRQIYDTNIYPKMQNTSLYEKLLDALK